MQLATLFSRAYFGALLSLKKIGAFLSKVTSGKQKTCKIIFIRFFPPKRNKNLHQLVRKDVPSFSILLLSVFSYLTFLIYGLAFFSSSSESSPSSDSFVGYILAESLYLLSPREGFLLAPTHSLSLSLSIARTHTHTHTHTHSHALLFSLHMFSPETSLDFCVVVAR